MRSALYLGALPTQERYTDLDSRNIMFIHYPKYFEIDWLLIATFVSHVFE